ncbi:phosphate ABC transporter substrate-binding protein [Thermocoleostomius sinensis]|jgi:phosphate transport system substrate-binding protein|uniref:Phosphate ABC transporter substrate-binding protein n=1 Tax=Thermocoleostomius sinensis A174 TaxID=2016057 RepID=A0A9E8ZAK6_9CYAN|nr:phosphate ABC transporter substrate-binding protein [Thermocoleostomius sinensis]WAL59608.1 phosphate ABC transporter substrate-binding protein [Thermocoleostomius sinensis A174]
MARQNNETVPLLLAFLITVGLIAAGFWFFGRNLISSLGQSPPSPTQPNQPPLSPDPTPSPNQATGGLRLDPSLPNPDVLTIDGSVTMVALMKQLQLAYTQVNPSLPTTYGVPDGRPNGTNAGIQNLIRDQVWMAASSRPLRPDETNVGLQGVPIARDALAIVVGVDNPFTGSLTLDQLKQIFQGQITNWSEVGGSPAPIRVINRAPDSGTYTLFQDVVLLGQPFAADGPNFTTAQQDETTPLLRSLGTDGITYSTVQQVVNQQTVRIVPINDISPTDREAVRTGNYPISRVVYLVAKQQTSPAVKQFIEMTLSPQGQQIVERVGFIPL